MFQVTIHTDGACSHNGAKNAIGGYGAIIVFGDHEKVVRGHAIGTTNNRMELLGVITGLEALKAPCKVILTTDSKYVVDSITKGWVYAWKKKNWIKTLKSTAKKKIF